MKLFVVCVFVIVAVNGKFGDFAESALPIVFGPSPGASGEIMKLGILGEGKLAGLYCASNFTLSQRSCRPFLPDSATCASATRGDASAWKRTTKRLLKVTVAVRLRNGGRICQLRQWQA